MAKDPELLKYLKNLHKEEDKYYVDLTSAAANKLADIQKMILDLEYCIKSCEMLIKFEEDKSFLDPLLFTGMQKGVLRLGLWSAIIVIYAKSFTDASKTNRRTKLDKRDYLEGASEELLTLHDKIMDARHTFIAHNSENIHEEIFTRMYITPVLDQPTFQLGYVNVKRISASPKELNNTIKLVEIIISKLKTKLDKLCDIVLKESAKDFLDKLKP
ncbi:MAG: hypothetical protein HYU70_00320 [Bacteroidetes bacterium]|nr:hypothetical protein [Bacteroidota bacterium]